MTGILYVSPLSDPANPRSPIVPTFLADTLATVPGETGLRLTPATTCVEELGRPIRAILRRKLHILGDTAVAYAGLGRHIATCHRDVLEKLPEWRGLQSPMRAFGDQVNLYWTYYGPQVIQALGVMWIPGRGFNNCTYQGLASEQHLGECAAVGSGHLDLLDRAREFGPTLGEVARTNVYERMRGFAGAMNGQRLALEMYFSQNPPNAWGGYVEYAFFDYGTQAWVRGPRSLNYFGVMEHRGGNNWTARRHDRGIAYDPGDGHSDGKVLTLSNTQSGRLISSWSISPDKNELHFGDAAGERWIGWQPDSFTLTILIPELDGSVRFTSRTNEHRERPLATFSATDRGIYCNLRDEYVEMVGKDICQARGWNYVPPN